MGRMKNGFSWFVSFALFFITRQITEPSLPELESEEPSESTWSSSSLYDDEFDDDHNHHREDNSNADNDEDAIVSFQVSNPTQLIWQWTQLLISFILVLHHSTNNSQIKRTKTKNTTSTTTTTTPPFLLPFMPWNTNAATLDEHCDECPPSIESDSQ